MRMRPQKRLKLKQHEKTKAVDIITEVGRLDSLNQGLVVHWEDLYHYIISESSSKILQRNIAFTFVLHGSGLNRKVYPYTGNND